MLGTVAAVRCTVLIREGKATESKERVIMILKNAVSQILTESGGLMTVEEVCRRNAERSLYKKGDGTFPDPPFILFGVKNYLDQFEVFVRLRT